MTTETKLPELTGSEKQVAWAEKIRAEVIAAWEEAKPNLLSIEEENYGEALPAEKIEQLQQSIAGTDAFINRQTRAAFWIDNRGIELESIYKKLGRGNHGGIGARGQMVYENGGVGPLSQ